MACLKHMWLVCVCAHVCVCTHVYVCECAWSPMVYTSIVFYHYAFVLKFWTHLKRASVSFLTWHWSFTGFDLSLQFCRNRKVSGNFVILFRRNRTRIHSFWALWDGKFSLHWLSEFHANWNFTDSLSLCCEFCLLAIIICRS